MTVGESHSRVYGFPLSELPATSGGTLSERAKATGFFPVIWVAPRFFRPIAMDGRTALFSFSFVDE